MQKAERQKYKKIKELGKTIGYGNLMDIASALWTLELERLHGIKNGAHIPTVEPFLTEEGKEVANESLQFRLDKLKYLGF